MNPISLVKAAGSLNSLVKQRSVSVAGQTAYISSKVDMPVSVAPALLMRWSNPLGSIESRALAAFLTLSMLETSRSSK